MFIACEVSDVVRETKRVRCEHCGYEVPANVYSRSHGDKCAYKDAPKGTKRCRKCGKYVPIENFTTAKGSTVDGRGSTCNACLNQKYYERRYPMLFGGDNCEEEE